MANIVYPTTGLVGSPVGDTGGRSHVHAGTDIRTPVGTPVVSSRDGTVTATGYNAGGYGNYVYVRNDDGTTSRYGHLQSDNVQPGQKVSAGDQIAYSGNTGHSSGPHLHYEVRDANGKVVKDQYGDNTEMNEAMRSRGTKIEAGKNAAGEKANKGDDKQPKDDGKGGDQKDREDKTDKNKAKGKEKEPPKANEHDDIKGKRNEYEQTKTKSIVGRMPTHEPWPFHPKTTVGPRQGIQRADAGNNKGTDSVTNPNQGTGSGDGNGGSNGGNNSNSSSGNDSNTPGGKTNIDKSSDPEKAAAIEREAKRLGINGEDLATIISYESAGSMSPSKRGGMNKDGSGKGSFLGLIQFSPDNQRKYGVNANQSFSDQMKSVGDYLIDRGVKPGMNQTQVYSAINAGRAAKSMDDPILNRSDVNGNQKQHVQKMNNSPHRSRAKKIMGSGGQQTQVERADKGINKDAKGQKPTAPGADQNSTPTSATTPTDQNKGTNDKGGSETSPNTNGNADKAGQTTGTGKGDAPKVRITLTGGG